MTPEQLWEKYSYFDADGDRVTGPFSFYDALKEYGESVRKQAVSVCRNHGETTANLNRSAGGFDCAAAIEKMEIGH